jgi:hypothetical protein
MRTGDEVPLETLYSVYTKSLEMIYDVYPGNINWSLTDDEVKCLQQVCKKLTTRKE